MRKEISDARPLIWSVLLAFLIVAAMGVQGAEAGGTGGRLEGGALSSDLDQRLQLYGLWTTNCMESSTGRQGRRLRGSEPDASHLASFNAWAGGGRRSLAWAEGPNPPPPAWHSSPPSKGHHGDSD